MSCDYKYLYILFGSDLQLSRNVCTLKNSQTTKKSCSVRSSIPPETNCVVLIKRVYPCHDRRMKLSIQQV
ncbi:hypothetical protein L6452_39011 [Arctium lappa]|uniref:Uncharacterized protein n=1 Tax=Arctium lappa TaxID=4217 RepID=A0ACB8XRN8_ARCLA|nr:hypothetical protein L6452_39011 [Arctium lappa]